MPSRMSHTHAHTSTPTNMCLLNHADVVGAVANGERDVAVALYQSRDLRLLQRRHATADAGLAFEPTPEEQVRQPGAQRIAQSLRGVVCVWGG